ncbi:permease prefix domain 1-containing protein [Deinococcus roseus]|uniref:Uncharacterized protein n=1 Tax=Deinococcus roseus TaxID=392414 RepID=A0ABQ2D484_9DEIO|nr:permease prefix domain 1-containing protein [Deinococcus roseus]GGJ45472.1 hypothetical protein GCM10008938_34770 [Deinococcus roseus]
MNALNHYLKQATRGLPRKQKIELWQELEADILERTNQHRAFGMTEHEALQKTLAQMGQPAAIQKGMQQVYLMPRITRFGAGTLLSGVLLMSATSSIHAELLITTKPPLPYCTTEKISAKCTQAYFNLYHSWVEVTSLKAELEKAGIKTEILHGKLKVNMPQKTLYFSLKNHISNWGEGTVFQRAGKTYISMNDFLNALRRKAPGAAKLTGAKEPILHLQNAQIPLPNYNAHLVLASNLGMYLMEQHGWKQFGYGSNLQEQPLLTVRTQAHSKTSYALIFRNAAGNPTIEIGDGQKDGSIVFNTSFPHPKKFYAVQDFKKLSPYPRKGRYPALLLELNGILNDTTQPYTRIMQDVQFP